MKLETPCEVTRPQLTIDVETFAARLPDEDGALAGRNCQAA